MTLKFKKDKSEWLTKPATVPVSEDMKYALDVLKKNKKVDVNQMTRDFWQSLLDRVQAENLSA